MVSQKTHKSQLWSNKTHQMHFSNLWSLVIYNVTGLISTAEQKAKWKYCRHQSQYFSGLYCCLYAKSHSPCFFSFLFSILNQSHWTSQELTHASKQRFLFPLINDSLSKHETQWANGRLWVSLEANLIKGKAGDNDLWHLILHEDLIIVMTKAEGTLSLEQPL